MQKRDLDHWFVSKVLPLEPLLVRFLRRNWRDVSEISDLRQEVYARTYESAVGGIPAQVKPFIFKIARNLMIDHLRRRQVVSIDSIADLEALNVPTEEVDVERQVSAREELRMLQQALNNVPSRARDVIVLRKVEGLSQREVAERMGITEDTVE